MEADIQALYRSMLRTEIGPPLRKLGLTGSSGIYLLPDDEQWLQIGFQKSEYTGRNSIRFTVNLSRVSKAEFAERRARFLEPGPERPPANSHGMVGRMIRLGNAMPPIGEDRWWTIVIGQPTAAVARQVLGPLTTLGIPWLRGELDDRDLPLHRHIAGSGREPD